jgi:hypothetical protein
VHTFPEKYLSQYKRAVTLLDTQDVAAQYTPASQIRRQQASVREVGMACIVLREKLDEKQLTDWLSSGA